MIKNLALLLVTILITLVLAELALRLTLVGSYSHNRGLLFYSAPDFVMADKKAVKYASNIEIRTVAVFGKIIDYDVSNKTNDLGFYDDVSYLNTDQAKRDIVFLGDSFTSSSGGNKPWVTKLREISGRSDINFYNLGVTGTGIDAFSDLLQALSNTVPVDEVNVMAITSDLFRSTWYPHSTADGIWFCRDQSSIEDCVEADPAMYRLQANDSRAEIIAKAQQIYKSKNTDRDRDRTFLQKQRVFNLFCDAIQGITKSTDSLPRKCPQHGLYYARFFQDRTPLARSLGTLTKMQKDFPEVKFRFFHLPEKNELNEGAYIIRISEYVAETGMQYIPMLTACEWDQSMFHKHDGHPNNNGYDNIAKCMANYLD